MDTLMGALLDNLNKVDADKTFALGNKALLDQVVTAGNNAATTDTDVTYSAGAWKHGPEAITAANANEHGLIAWGGKIASLTGVGGVALMEAAKEAISTFVANLTSVGANANKIKTIAERKMQV